MNYTQNEKINAEIEEYQIKYSALEIGNKNYVNSKITDLINRKPDILFIMINPGQYDSESSYCDEQR